MSADTSLLVYEVISTGNGYVPVAVTLLMSDAKAIAKSYSKAEVHDTERGYRWLFEDGKELTVEDLAVEAVER